MNRLSTLFFTGFLLLSLPACELALLDTQNDTDPQAIFDEAWTFVDRNYSYFEYKEIDWAATYDEYAARIEPGMTDAELFDVMADMLYELRDGHVNLSTFFDFSRNWRWFLDHPANFNYDLLERSYFREEQQFVGPFVVFDFDDVGYVRYSSFSGSFSDGQLSYIIQQFKDHKGIILDIRDNGGGSSTNATRLAARFLSESTVVAQSRYRSGPEHTDFSDWSSFSLSPYTLPEGGQEEDHRFTKPVVVLTNRSCYSASSLFTQYMREIPTVTIIGDWTGGGGGTPTFTELANGWILRVSTTQLAAPDGFQIEHGTPPDIAVSLDPADVEHGEDTLLEFALDFLR